MVTAATIYMSLAGAAGLRAWRRPACSAPRIWWRALERHRRRQTPRSRRRASTKPCCCWTARSRRCWRRWRAAGSSAASISPSRYPELGHALLVCATETKLDADIDAYARALADVMNSSRAAA